MGAGLENEEGWWRSALPEGCRSWTAGIPSALGTSRPRILADVNPGLWFDCPCVWESGSSVLLCAQGFCHNMGEKMANSQCFELFLTSIDEDPAITMWHLYFCPFK